MRRVLVLLILGTVFSGIAAYASTARRSAAADPARADGGADRFGAAIPAEAVAPR